MVSVFDDISQIISEVCDIDRSLIRVDSNILDELGVDSLDFLDVAFEIDRKFEIKLPVEDWVVRINDGEATAADYFTMERLVYHVETLMQK